jgi:hypothetical protein
VVVVFVIGEFAAVGCEMEGLFGLEDGRLRVVRIVMVVRRGDRLWCR